MSKSSDLMNYMKEAVPFWKTLGLELVEANEGMAKFEVTFDPKHDQNGIMHGGVLASLIDSACAVAAISKIYPDAYATSINLNIAYLKPVSQGKLRATGECIRAGKTVMFCEAKVWNEAGELVCTGSSQLARIASKAVAT